MQPEILKVPPQSLRSMGLDERWLQSRLEEDPTLFGLGEVQVVRRERRQSSGGRIDFLLYEPEKEVRYVAEVMLGALDESHIIRAIEYWDLERQKYALYEHRAVIVAEEITARFFNVIRLLNRSVPLIAIQLSGFKLNDRVVLQFHKVLDIYEEQTPEEESGGDRVDRQSWEKKSNPQSLAVLDKIVTLYTERVGTPRLTYNKFHVALNAGAGNFAWFHPRKEAPHCHLILWTPAELRDDIAARFGQAGLPATPQRNPEELSIRLTTVNIDKHRDLLADVLAQIAKAAG